MTKPLWPIDFTATELRVLAHYSEEAADDWHSLYYNEWPEPKMKWVIPHGSSLDYCHVEVGDITRCGRYVRVSGRRTEGWTMDGAHIKTRVPLDKLTEVPSWREDFKDLYDYEYHPKLRAEWPRDLDRTDRPRHQRPELDQIDAHERDATAVDPIGPEHHRQWLQQNLLPVRLQQLHTRQHVLPAAPACRA